jgi:hypothetical protein
MSAGKRPALGLQQMAIYRLLNSATFGPEEIACMTAVYENALLLLGLTDRNDPLTEIIAQKIIAIAKTGETGPEKMLARVLDEIRSPP